MRLNRFWIASVAILGTVMVGGAAAGATTGPVAQFGTPDISVAGLGATVSHDWSGYAVTAGKHQTFNYVHTTFVQPAIACSGMLHTFVSAWVGLDGFKNSTAEQVGTAAHCGGPGSSVPSYSAWYEMYPTLSVRVLAVHAGDVIDATVAFAAGQYTLSFTDLTTDKGFSRTETCAGCQRTSAEWVVARPAYCSSAACTSAYLTRLPDFGAITMGSDTVSVDGGPLKQPGDFTHTRIAMVQGASGGGVIALDGTSPLSAENFTVTWQRLGKPYPVTL